MGGWRSCSSWQRYYRSSCLWRSLPTSNHHSKAKIWAYGEIPTDRINTLTDIIPVKLYYLPPALSYHRPGQSLSWSGRKPAEADAHSTGSDSSVVQFCGRIVDGLVLTNEFRGPANSSPGEPIRSPSDLQQAQADTGLRNPTLHPSCHGWRWHVVARGAMSKNLKLLACNICRSSTAISCWLKTQAPLICYRTNSTHQEQGQVSVDLLQSQLPLPLPDSSGQRLLPLPPQS